MTVHIMSDIELDRLDTIKQLIDRQITRQQAADILGLTTRHINRLSKAYKNDGVDGLVSKRRGKPSNRRYPDSFKEYVIHHVRQNYGDFGPKLAAEKLAERHSLHVSVPTLRAWMIDAGIWQTRREKRKRVYQPRNRRDCFGELIQIDGSDHCWFEDRGERCTLIVFIDDATGQLMELQFVPSESTFAYFDCTKRYLERYGKPVAFYSDKHSVFRVNKAGATTGNGMTQFGRALHELNIDIICANTSQAKGRVERANRTLQDRLVKELRLQGINSIEDGNDFLDGFRIDYNRRFGKVPANDKDVHRTLSEFDILEDTMTWQEDRTVTNSLTVQYDRVMYLLEPNDTTLELRRKKVRIYDYPDGTIDIKYDGLSLPYSVFDKVSQVKQADVVSNKRLGAALKFVQEKQKETAFERSKKAPKRSMQKQSISERRVNSAAL